MLNVSYNLILELKDKPGEAEGEYPLKADEGDEMSEHSSQEEEKIRIMGED